MLRNNHGQQHKLRSKLHILSGDVFKRACWSSKDHGSTTLPRQESASNEPLSSPGNTRTRPRFHSAFGRLASPLLVKVELSRMTSICSQQSIAFNSALTPIERQWIISG